MIFLLSSVEYLWELYTNFGLVDNEESSKSYDLALGNKYFSEF